MAIKPNDCVIRIEDLIIGTKEVVDSWNGRMVEVDRYEQYWENFQEHINEVSKSITQTTWNQSPYDIAFEQELNKHGGSLKQTKNWNNRYIKFKSHSHLTMFVLRFS
jgi:hypothetical protein